MKSKNQLTYSSIESLSQTTISSNSSAKNPKRRRSRKSGKLKKQEKIRRLVLNYGNKEIPISFKQIAKKVECTENYAKTTISKLVKAGRVIKTKTQFLSNRYAKPRVLCGKNLYTSPKNDVSKTNPKSSISTKVEIAKGITPRDFSKRKISKEGLKKEEKVNVLKLFGFESLIEEAPDWWFRDLKKLKKSLKLLKNKIKLGYNCRNKVNFITFLLKHGIFGYRHHCARNLSLAVNKPTLKRVEPYMASPYVANGYESLKELHKKHDLDLQFTNIQKLLRKGFSHLAMSADVMLKRLKLPGVQNTNAFLHHIVSMKEPVDVLRRKTA